MFKGSAQIKSRVSKLATVSLISSILPGLLPVLVVGNLLTASPIAVGAVTSIALETSTAIANADLVDLGSLASRSGSTTSSTKSLTKSSNASAPFTMTGTDGLSGQSYQFQTMQSYGTRAQTLKESVDFTSTIISAGGINPYGLTGGLTGGKSTKVTNAVTFVDSKSVSKTGVQLESDMSSIPSTNNANAYGSVFGPQIWSVPFIGVTSKSLSFDWAADNGQDDYEIYAFLVKISSATDATCTAASGASTYGLTNPTTTHTLLAYSRGTTQAWITNAAPVPSDGCYRFRFVSGTYDQTGGLAVGASLYVSNTVTVGATQTITFPQPTDYVRTSSDIVISAGASTDATGATLSYLSADTSKCTVLSDGTITLKATGTCTITVSSGSTSDFAAAQPVTRAFAILGAPAAPSGQGTGYISGAAETCANLTATLGTWNDGGDAITATSYQWKISSTLGGTYANISGATSSTYTVASGDLNKYLKVTFSRTNSVGTGSETSAALLISSQGSSCVATSAATPNVNLPPFRIDWATNSGYGYMNPQYGFVGSTILLYQNTYKKDGYSFAGWNTKADGTGITYADGGSFPIGSSDVILYAQWKLIQTKPTITWTIPAAIQEGTPLSATQLNAVASVQGTYTYSPASTALLTVGKHTLKVTFVPTDPKFETIETTVEIEVLTKAKVTWANPSSIIEGTALSATQLNATASVPGTFSYDPKDGTVLAVGKHTLKVTFTPTDSRLTPVTAEATIEVVAKPVVIPTAPMSPTYSVTGAPNTTINWGAGKDAATYTVLVDGNSACSVAELTCDVTKLLGPKNVVTVTSVATGGKTSVAVKATYVAPSIAQVLTVVNFDTARSVIKSTEAPKLRVFASTIKAAGYTSLTVYGHTDSVGGFDNQKLSVARANAAITYLKKLLPGVKFVVSGFAASEPVGDNSTAEGKAANRRAEIFIP